MEYKVVPTSASVESIDAGVAFALNVALSREYRWTDYIRDLYASMVAMQSDTGMVAVPRAELESLQSQLTQARADATSAFKWLSDVRFALGDDGKRMLPELVEFAKSLVVELEQLRGRLAEAEKLLRFTKQFVVNGVELGFIRMPDLGLPDTANDLLPGIIAYFAQPAGTEGNGDGC